MEDHLHSCLVVVQQPSGPCLWYLRELRGRLGELGSAAHVAADQRVGQGVGVLTGFSVSGKDDSVVVECMLYGFICFFLEGHPQVTMIVKILKWSHDLNDLGYHHFRKPSYTLRLLVSNSVFL